MGKIEIDHTGTGGGITLSSDGTDLLLDGTAIGGGGAALELYAENPVTPVSPSATGTNAVAIGSGAIASDTRAVALGLSRADGDDAVAIGIGATNLTYGARATGALAAGYQASATALQASAVGGFATASGSRSNAFGYETDATNTNSNAFGSFAQSVGTNSTAIARAYASGADSFSAAIATNSTNYGASGANSIVLGSLAKATGTDSLALGDRAWATATASTAIGRQSYARGTNSIAIGLLSEATAQGSIAIGNGYSFDGPQATFYNAIAIGQGSLSDKVGKVAISGFAFAASGDSQHGIFVLRVATTDATATPLVTGANILGSEAADANNQVILPNNSAYAFHGTIVARQQASAGTACAAWKVEGLIRREGSAGTTVLVNSATTVLDNTPAWGMALTADTTNGGLAITVTGAAATNIRWVATINTSEVTY